MKLLDKVIIVTGASKGIGRSMALRFGGEGARVICSARTQSEIETVANEIREKGGQAKAIRCDVGDEEQIKNMVEQTTREFGKIDTLVNNAGLSQKIVSGGPTPLYQMTKEAWDSIINTNLTGAFLCARFVLGFMVPQKKGNIINISSGRGWTPRKGIGAYVCSKHGMEGLTKQLALELAEFGINVNSLIPGGGVLTPGQGSGEWLSSGNTIIRNPTEEQLKQKPWLPMDVMNNAAVFLASQDPHRITGKVFVGKEFNEQNFTSVKDVEEWIKTLDPIRLLEDKLSAASYRPSSTSIFN